LWSPPCSGSSNSRPSLRCPVSSRTRRRGSAHAVPARPLRPGAGRASAGPRRPLRTGLDRQVDTVAVEDGTSRHERVEQTDGALGCCAVREGDRDDGGAERRFELGRGPSAMALPWSMTRSWWASRSASSRYWVVRSTVVPTPTSCSMTTQRSCGSGGRARWWARRGTGPVGARRGRRRGRVGAACRPSRS